MAPTKKSHSTACVTLFFDMRSYKIESYVPEETFLTGKDARFCRAAFADCFVVDANNDYRIIAACRRGELVGTSLAKAFSISMTDAASLLYLFNGSNDFFILPCPAGTLIVCPAWQRLELALAFFLKEDAQTVEKAYQNAQRYAFSMVFDAEQEREKDPQLDLEIKLCTLKFYMNRLFGAKRETNVTAQILMIANLVGCRLHEVSLSHTSITLDEREVEKLGAYLCCTFMTMRRYNGAISTSDKEEETPDFSTHVLQEYGLQIQQSVREKGTHPAAFDIPSNSEISSFASHPAFADFKTEESEGTLRLHLSLRQKALLSSITARGTEKEIIITLFPLN